ncbi:MAG: hypothetical protein ABJA37_09685 [Ferruginibacter sp.]
MNNNIINIRQVGKEITALITEIPHRSHSMYKVMFESGYENIFFTDVETGKWIEEDLGFTILASNVGEEIKKISQNFFHVPKILTWHKQEKGGKLISFGFYKFMTGISETYEIYSSNKKYMYTIANTNNVEWHVVGSTVEMLDKTDCSFIQNLTKILPFYYPNI